MARRRLVILGWQFELKYQFCFRSDFQFLERHPHDPRYQRAICTITAPVFPGDLRARRADNSANQSYLSRL